MSCVCIMTPLVIAAWPAFSAAVMAAASSLGYELAEAAHAETQSASRKASLPRRVTLEIPQSEIVTGPLGRDQRIEVRRDGVTVVFSRDVRGRAAVCASGTGRTDEELRAIGEAMSRRVVQQYVYQRLKSEMDARRFVVVEETIDDSHTIRLKVRHWET
jgi:hypothetical protein